MYLRAEYADTASTKKESDVVGVKWRVLQGLIILLALMMGVQVTV
jgi:hypothetical protein